MDWTEKVVLVTGGTGSFGRKFVEVMLEDYQPAKLIVFSRDELKQHEMRAGGLRPPVACATSSATCATSCGLRRAMQGVDIVVHAAALKQVPACEYNPFEAIMTNIMGGRNVVDAALDSGVRAGHGPQHRQGGQPGQPVRRHQAGRREALRPTNAYAGGTGTRFSCVRYGNVVGSRGSVVPVFLRQRRRGGSRSPTSA